MTHFMVFELLVSCDLAYYLGYTLMLEYIIPIQSYCCLTLYRPYAPYDVFLQFPQTTVCAIWRILHTA